MFVIEESELKKLRKEVGLSQGDVAKALGVTQGAVSKWELGDSRPSLSPAKMLLLCDLYDVSLRRLARATGEEINE